LNPGSNNSQLKKQQTNVKVEALHTKWKFREMLKFNVNIEK
jgi:hypothetical protein